MKDFYRTQAGRKFFDADVPALVKALQEISQQLKVANDLKQRESKFNEKLKVIELKEHKKK